MNPQLPQGAGAALRLELVVLILTPVLRVLATLVLFALQRDWPFVVITGVVLLLLLLGLAAFGAEVPR